MAPSRVREDDGTLVPFRERKVAEGIASALAAAGEPDRALADELAGVVTLFIDRAFPVAPPAVSDVLDLSERVLDETGHVKAARAFRRLRQQRDELRRMIAVRRVKTPAPDALEHAPDGEDPALAAWSRSKLIAALIDEEGVPAPIAQDIASAVERRLVEGGFTVVTTTLIREFAADEMFRRGLTRSESDAAAEVAWRDVARALYADEAEARAPDAVVAGPVLARFALKDLHGPAVVRAHRTGRLHLVGLEQPVAVERAVVPVALLFGDAAGSDPRRLLLRARATLGSLRPHVRDTVALPDLVGFLARRVDTDVEAWVDDLLLAVVPRDAFGRPVRPLDRTDGPHDRLRRGRRRDARAGVRRCAPSSGRATEARLPGTAPRSHPRRALRKNSKEPRRRARARRGPTRYPVGIPARRRSVAVARVGEVPGTTAPLGGTGRVESPAVFHGCRGQVAGGSPP
jgi:hypothetical protein